jgi:thiamine-phosphate diphosphorylase
MRPHAPALPRLHLVTDDAVLALPDFVRAAGAVVQAGGPRVALHVRGHATPAATLFVLGTALRDATRASGALLFVNDRVDIAACVAADGVQLGRRSLPIDAARRVMPAALIGCSVHSARDAALAAGSGTDFVVAGTIWPTASHPQRAASGVALVAAASAAAAAARGTAKAGSRAGGGADRGAARAPAPTAHRAPPVLGIGGVTPERIAELVAAGAYGAAVLGGVWHAAQPFAALRSYLAALDAAVATQHPAPDFGE